MNPTITRVNSSIAPAIIGAPWYRHRWPWLLMVGPAAVVAAGIVTIVIAFSRQDALVADDYYKQGKAINQDLRRDRAAHALAMAAGVSYHPATGQLRGHVSRAGKGFSAPLLMSLVHSTQPEKDLQIPIQPDAEGNFIVPMPMLDAARWQVKLESADRAWRLQTVWQWPQTARVTLTARESSMP